MIVKNSQLRKQRKREQEEQAKKEKELEERNVFQKILAGAKEPASVLDDLDPAEFDNYRFDLEKGEFWYDPDASNSSNRSPASRSTDENKRAASVPHREPKSPMTEQMPQGKGYPLAQPAAPIAQSKKKPSMTAPVTPSRSKAANKPTGRVNNPKKQGSNRGRER